VRENHLIDELRQHSNLIKEDFRMSNNRNNAIYNKLNLKKNMKLETVRSIIDSPDLKLTAADYAIGVRYAVTVDREWAPYLANGLFKRIGDFPTKVKNGMAKLNFKKGELVDEKEYTQYWLKKYKNFLNLSPAEQCVQGFIFIEGWVIEPTSNKNN
jgi:hypothetical protein